MELFEPTKSFDYNKITLENPRPVQGGSYFTKITMNEEKLLYIQFPKCYTKQGIISTKRGKYCDLMYERVEENELFEWIEGLENRCQELIDSKKHIWFNSDLSRDDIESMMTPIYRLYKSGKKLLIRVNIDNNKSTGKDKCIVYDEKELLTSLDVINDEKMIIPLLHIEGIKFTSRSFEIELKLFQLMVLDTVPEFGQSCMIKREKYLPVQMEMNLPVKMDMNLSLKKDNLEELEENSNGLNIDTNTKTDLDVKTKECVNYLEDEQYIDNKECSNNLEETSNFEDELNNNLEEENNNLEEITNLDIIDDLDDSNELREIDLDINEDDEPIILKKPNEVYYEIYKSARDKAKHMREVAIQAYLEAKQIKSKYMLSDIEDSDDESNLDFDTEL